MTHSPGVPALFEGVGVPPGQYSAEGTARPRFRAVLGLLALGLSVGMIVIALWDRAVTDAATYACPPDCGRPPNAVAVANLPRFTSIDGAFSVSHPPASEIYAVSTEANGVRAQLTAGDGGLLRLFSQPAQGAVARQLVAQLMAKQYANAEVVYELPNTTVGYQLGYGVVANFRQPGMSNSYPMRVIIMAAVKNDLALIAVAEGPFRRFSQDFGPGPPSAANTEIAMDMGKYVDSFSWKGDPPR
jgi:hypothetical protein